MTQSPAQYHAIAVTDDFDVALDKARRRASRDAILADVVRERARQDAKWGPQRHPDIDAPDSLPTTNRRRRQNFANQEKIYKRINDARAARGADGVWIDIWLEEVFEAAAAGSTADLRKELVESIAVAVAWIEDIDTRDREDA